MSNVALLRLGVAGLGGYAGGCVNVVAGEAGEAAGVKLTAVCEPDLALHADRITELRAAGVTVLADYDELLDQPIDAVWLPLPIQLHRPFTEKALAKGVSVLCEKPAAGSIQDVDAMIAARDRADRLALIGFQDVYDPSTARLKQRLVDGAIGRIRSLRTFACWPRYDTYFNRSPWAGAIQRDGVWVLDSPVNNAMAHYVNLPLFFAGASREASASPVAVEAELYRVNPIENYDTACIRATLDTGAELLVLMTHAGETLVQPTLWIEGERGRAVWTRESITLETPAGVETLTRESEARRPMLRAFAQAARGQAPEDIALATLETARSHALLVSGVSAAAKINDVPESVVRVSDHEHGRLRAIPGIEQAFEAAVNAGQLLHETRRFPWTQPPASLDLTGFTTFTGPA